MEKTDQKAQKAIDQSTENQGELKHLKFLFDDLEERYNKQQNLLNQDLKNRSLRIEQLSLFEIWAKSKMKNHGKTLIKDASKPNLKSHSRLLRKWGRTSYNIERAHRQPLNQNGKSKSKTPVIIVKFANWSFSEKVKSPEQPPPILQSSMLMCPFLLVIPLNVLFLKEVTNNVATWKSTSKMTSKLK